MNSHWDDASLMVALDMVFLVIELADGLVQLLVVEH